MLLLLVATVVVQPWHWGDHSDVLPYATSMSRQQLLEETNAYRNSQKIGSLALNGKLNKAAQAKAQDMADRNYWSHTTPDGHAPWVFIEAYRYPYQKAGENLAYGFTTSQQVVAGWMNSETHRDNMLDKNYRDIGFGFANNPNFDSNGPATIVVAMYGTTDPVTTPVVSDTQGFSNLSNLATQPEPQAINKIQSFTGGSWPWSSYLIGFVVGAAAMFLVAKHTLALKRAVVEGEKFLITHPVLDVTLIALIVVGVLISQQIGVIL